jgi:hypothetical protein
MQQTDGNFVVYASVTGGRPLWASNTFVENSHLEVRSGTLVIVNSTGGTVWQKP